MFLRNDTQWPVSHNIVAILNVQHTKHRLIMISIALTYQLTHISRNWHNVANVAWIFSRLAPPSYRWGEKATQKSSVCEVEDEETQNIVDSGQHEGLPCHTSLPASSGGAPSKWSWSGNVELPRGNPCFHMHSLISLSEIYGERGRAPRSAADHFSYRIAEHDGLSKPLIAFRRSSRNCLCEFLRFLRVSVLPSVPDLFLASQNSLFPSNQNVDVDGISNLRRIYLCDTFVPNK